MAQTPQQEIAAILTEGMDTTIATLRPDGAPHATTVSYASDGVAIFFGCGDRSQKAANLARDSRVALTVNLPHKDWAQIRGLSISGRAHELRDPDDIALVGLLFMVKYPEAAQLITGPEDSIVFFRVDLEVVSILDYRKGFGHTELVHLGEQAAEAA